VIFSPWILTCHHQVNGARQLLSLDAQTALDLAIVAGLDPFDADAALSGRKTRSVVRESGGLVPLRRQVEDLLLPGYLNPAVVDRLAIATEQIGTIILVERAKEW